MIAVAVMVALGLAFIRVYAGMLGDTSWHLWHHLAVLLPLIALCCSLVGCAAAADNRVLRGLLAWLACLVFVFLQLGFYFACLVSLYGFRDLPTRQVISGYTDQILSMVAVLPVSRVLLLGLALLVLVSFAVLAAVLARLLLRSVSGTQVAWPRIAALSAVAAGLVLSDPWQGLSTAREPVVSALHNHALSASSLGRQSNPIEVAADRQVEAAYLREPAGTRKHVVFIYVDGLRADVLQPYGGAGEMPFVDELVRSGRLRQFSNTFSSCSQTLCGLGSILQSRPAHRVALGNFSLPKVLKRQGYELRYLLSGDHQSFLGLKDYYGPGIDSYVDGKDMDPRRSTDDLVLLDHLRQLPSSTEAGTPQFIMLGLMSVHVWGQRHDQFRSHLPDRISSMDFLDADLLSKVGEAAGPYRNNYLNGVRQTDHVMRGIWQWLDEAGYLRDSIVVITSDHGESLGENGMLGHARDLSTPEIHIPLWIHVPDPAWVDQPFAFQTDIAPTILDWLQLPAPESWVGQSLLQPRDRGVTLPLFFMNRSDQFGLIFESGPHLYKYLYDRSRERESLHDLYVDKVDATDLAGHPDAPSMATLRSKLNLEFGSMMLSQASHLEGQ